MAQKGQTSPWRRPDPDQAAESTASVLGLALRVFSEQSHLSSQATQYAGLSLELEDRETLYIVREWGISVSWWPSGEGLAWEYVTLEGNENQEMVKEHPKDIINPGIQMCPKPEMPLEISVK